MGKNIVEKILAAHCVQGTLRKGEEIGIRIDQTLTQDATGTMAYLAFEAMGVARPATELSVSYVDHNTLQDSFENADDHKYLETVARKYGIRYSRAGNGICHQVHLERFARPGRTLLGSDSHTCTAGAMGMVAIGAGGLDVALAMAGEPFFLICPKVTNVILTGKLRPWVAAKDIILEVLRRKTTKGNVNTAIEYSGPGVATLSLTERATMTNMGAELGVTTSVFPSDHLTRAFLVAQGRGSQWKRLEADPDAHYDETLMIDLATLEPMIACPHSPDQVKKVRDVQGTKVDQVCVGSCTNASYRDLVFFARALAKRALHPEVSLVVAPGSKQVFEMLAASGMLTPLIEGGARIVESSCGFCIGIGQAPRDHAVSVRTNNRNFLGRSGTKTAGVYLASPEVAFAAAVTGTITDPRDLTMTYPVVRMPKKFAVNDNMILCAKKPDPSTEVYRGSNIKMPPVFEPLPATIEATVAIKVGDKITTDHIMPAGKRLKYRSNVYTYADFVFEGVDASFAERAKKEKANIIVAGKSYGQGSSREHAALCPAYLGVKAVLAQSIERIHRANLINFGILPLTFVDETMYEHVHQGQCLALNHIRQDVERIAANGQPVAVVLENKTTGATFKANLELSPREAAIVLAGGSLNYVKRKGRPCRTT